jgi:hypothetical protein
MAQSIRERVSRREPRRGRWDDMVAFSGSGGGSMRGSLTTIFNMTFYIF